MSSATEVAQQYIAHAYAGRIPEAAAMLSESVELTMGGGGAMAGTYRGRENYFAAFGRMMTLTNGTYTTIGDTRWVDGGDIAIALAKEQVVRDGETIQLDRAITFQVTAQQLIDRVRVYEGDPAAADRAFAAAGSSHAESSAAA